MDLFNLTQINKQVIDFGKKVLEVSNVCENYVKKPDSENSDKIVQVMSSIEEQFNQLKDEVVQMANEIEGIETPINGENK